MKGLFVCFSVFLSLQVAKWPVCREDGSSFLCLMKFHCCVKCYLMPSDAFLRTSLKIINQHRNIDAIIGRCLNCVCLREMLIAVFAGFYFHNLSIHRPAYYFNIRNFSSSTPYTRCLISVLFCGRHLLQLRWSFRCPVLYGPMRQTPPHKRLGQGKYPALAFLQRTF